MSNTKKFAGKVYRWCGTWSSKTLAILEAKSKRRQGHYARVSKEDGGYAVYFR